MEEEVTKKKPKRFSGKEFRALLLTNDRAKALQSFITICREEKMHDSDCVHEYLESGGNCLEIVKLLEHGQQTPQIFVLEATNYVLLQVIANYGQHRSNAHEACRYLLNMHIQMINKMLGMTSSAKERRIILKLLAAVAIFSTDLAKDILLHVNFHSDNLELLTKHLGSGEETVRQAFIHFVVSFLVEGYYPLISLLMEKAGVLTSIINGLQFDDADTVCMVMTELKTKILENTQVKKTAKMKMFSTPVCKDIVNLYNWRGPVGMYQGKRVKTVVAVNEQEKSKVSQAVHEFLVILCTSHKFGVIFKDKNVGLGRKHQNPLMYTIFASLEKPWEHSYAGELVTKICAACPDLVKSMWLNLKPYLQPRNSVQWLRAIRYATVLIKQLEPSCIEHCIKDFNVSQCAQMIQVLVAPTAILKTLLPKEEDFPSKVVKQEILAFLLDILQRINAYLELAERTFSSAFTKKLKETMSEHIRRNFPLPHVILTDWDKKEDELYGFPELLPLKYLEVVLNILKQYCTMCPSHLDQLSNNFNVIELLTKISHFEDADVDSVNSLQIKAIGVYAKYDINLFEPKGEVFTEVVPLLFEIYHKKPDPETREIFIEILRSTGVFEGSEYEMSHWLNGVLTLKKYDRSVGTFFVELVLFLNENSVEFAGEMDEIRKQEQIEETSNFDGIFESLCSDEVKFEAKNVIKHTSFSHAPLAALKRLKAEAADKSLKQYLNFVFVNVFHYQTNCSLFKSLITKYQDLLPQALTSYICESTEIVDVLQKMGKLKSFALVNAAISQNDSKIFTDGHVNCYCDMNIDLLRMIVSYLVKMSVLDEPTYNCCTTLVKALMVKGTEQEFNAVLNHPSLLHMFSPLHSSKLYYTKFIVDAVKLIPDTEKFAVVHCYRSRLFGILHRYIRKSKPKCDENLLATIAEVQLNFQQSCDILTCLSELDPMTLLDSSNKLSDFYAICVYALRRCTDDKTLEPLDESAILGLARHVTHLNEVNKDSGELAQTYSNYLTKFPHTKHLKFKKLFASTLMKSDYCKGNSSLCSTLLRYNPKYFDIALSKLEDLSTKKGLYLPLIENFVELDAPDEFLEKAFTSFKQNILKSLQKPQKAGQYFQKHYKGVCYLLKRFASEDDAKPYIEKVQKFDVVEPFHAHMLKEVFLKFANTERLAGNAILTLTHLLVAVFKRGLKTEEELQKLRTLAEIFKIVAEKLSALENASFEQVQKNDTFKLLVKFCLKFGLEQKEYLLEILRVFVECIGRTNEEADALMEMTVSHSEFLNVALSNNTACKRELLKYLLVLCSKYPNVMKREHVAVLLASYSATVSHSDRSILQLLKLYESSAAHTNFYDFKPFLWNVAARNHYSVRNDVQKSLWRQPRTGDVLNILNESWVKNTIKHFPLNSSLKSTAAEPIVPVIIYDLSFLLPLFSHLLAPENSVQTYRFAKSGALSLTVVALSSSKEDIRKAACHVLYRYYCQLEGVKKGKDNQLWQHFVEALCKGTAVLENFHLNCFASIFYARMALILSNPQEMMYAPLGQYLRAKPKPNLSSIPELYTFLHSSDVNFKEHRLFILEVLRDGLRTDREFDVFAHSMAYKLLMEMYSSAVSDNDTKLTILEIFARACLLSRGVQLLCNNYGLLSWLTELVFSYSNGKLLHAMLLVLYNIITHSDTIDLTSVEFLANHLIDVTLNDEIQGDVSLLLLKCIFKLFSANTGFLSERRLEKLVDLFNDDTSRYVLKFKTCVPCDSVSEENAKTVLLQLTNTWISGK